MGWRESPSEGAPLPVRRRGLSHQWAFPEHSQHFHVACMCVCVCISASPSHGAFFALALAAKSPNANPPSAAANPTASSPAGRKRETPMAREMGPAVPVPCNARARVDSATRSAGRAAFGPSLSTGPPVELFAWNTGNRQGAGSAERRSEGDLGSSVSWAFTAANEGAAHQDP